MGKSSQPFQNILYRLKMTFKSIQEGIDCALMGGLVFFMAKHL